MSGIYSSRVAPKSLVNSIRTFRAEAPINMLAVLEAQNAALRTLVSDLTSQTAQLREQAQQRQEFGGHG
jgi:hypothetical protein